jgi:D-amino-acid dehydrogenase
MLREDGVLELYESEAEFQATLPGWHARERSGIDFRHVVREALPEFQPGLSPRFVKGTFVPSWKTVSNPQDLGKAVWRYAEGKGARFIRASVKEAAPGGKGAVIVLEDGRTVEAARLLVAAGAWSHRLARNFGDRVPLETERGYNTTFPASAFDIRRQLVFSGHGFVITPLENAVRVGGAVELGGLQLPPNYRRSRAMVEKAKAFLPGFDAREGREWMGYRPSMPDSVPVIGTSPKHPFVFYAFGHGHLGLTQAAATARLVRDLVLGREAAIDLKPFSVQRF